MKKVLISALALTAMVGCVPVAKITSEPVAANVTQDAADNRINGKTTTMTIRTFAPKTDTTKRAEIIGAKCTIVSDELRATVITPQQVILPDFKQRKELANRGVPGSLNITCKAGERTGQTLVTAQPKSAGTVTNAGIAAAIVTAVVTSAVATATPWTFPIATNIDMAE